MTFPQMNYLIQLSHKQGLWSHNLCREPIYSITLTGFVSGASLWLIPCLLSPHWIAVTVRDTARLQAAWSGVHQSAQVIFQDTALPLARCLSLPPQKPSILCQRSHHCSRIIRHGSLFDSISPATPSMHPLFTMFSLTPYPCDVYFPIRHHLHSLPLSQRRC